jgi:lipoprotein-anchoring transpeptidase ErfK/SrfK
MRRWLGLFGSWALLILALSVLGVSAAAEWLNIADQRLLGRWRQLDQWAAEEQNASIDRLRKSLAAETGGVDTLKSKVADTTGQIQSYSESDADQTIVVSTEENRLYLKRGRSTMFEAVCSTGKGPTKVSGGKVMVFDTPIGKFHVLSKETDPVWVPPDWHFEEEARKRGMRVVHLEEGMQIDADTGGPVQPRSHSLWSLLGQDDSGSRRVLKVKGNTVLEDDGGVEHELPPGQLITATNAMVVPPIGSPQRRFAGVLGAYRLNLGNGYAIHGTQATAQLGQSVSHGCVRLGDKDIKQLFEMTQVGDEVIIY